MSMTTYQAKRMPWAGLPDCCSAGPCRTPHDDGRLDWKHAAHDFCACYVNCIGPGIEAVPRNPQSLNGRAL